MKIFKIELCILTLILIGVLVSNIKIGLGYYHFHEIQTALFDKDWEGIPDYIVKELHFQDRAYEDADCYMSKYTCDTEEVISDFPHILLRITHEDYVSNPPIGFLEVCLDITEENITPSKKKLFSKELELHYVFDVAMNPMIPMWISSKDDYKLEYHSKLTWNGVGSAQYQKEKIREFVLRKCLENLQEYGQLEVYANRLANNATVE